MFICSSSVFAWYAQWPMATLLRGAGALALACTVVVAVDLLACFAIVTTKSKRAHVGLLSRSGVLCQPITKLGNPSPLLPL
jgi:hypothetical protein